MLLTSNSNVFSHIHTITYLSVEETDITLQPEPLLDTITLTCPFLAVTVTL